MPTRPVSCVEGNGAVEKCGTDRCSTNTNNNTNTTIKVARTAAALPGGVVTLVPSSAWLGVCVFDEFSHCIRCCKVAWAHRSFALDEEDAAWPPSATAILLEAPPHQRPDDNDDGRTAVASGMGEEQGAAPIIVDDDGDEGCSSWSSCGALDRFIASGGVVSWLVQLLSSMDPSKLTVCRPSSNHFPDALEGLLRELVLRRGGTVRLFQQREHHLERAMGQLQSLWPSTTVASWCGRLKLFQPNGASAAAADAELVAALSCTLDLVIRTGHRVADVVEQPPVSLVLVDAGTLHALTIFRQDAHPCAYQGIGGSKEGCSLHAAFLSRTQTPMGRALLRQWMLCPINDVAELTRRQGVVAFFAMPGVYPIVGQLSAALQHLKHPGRIMHRIRSARHTVRDYVELLRCAGGLMKLHTLLQQAIAAAAAEWPHGAGGAGEVPAMVHRLIASIDIAALASLSDCIRSTVSLTSAAAASARSSSSSGMSSCGGGGGVGAPILPGVDGELDELRAHYGQLGPYLTHVAEELALALPPMFSHWKLSCVFYPRVGFLVAVNLDSGSTTAQLGAQPPSCYYSDQEQRGTTTTTTAGSLPSTGGALLPATMTLPHEWEMVFQTAECVYCRAPSTRALDESIGDIHTAMVLRESTVQVMVDEAILARAPCILTLLHFAELDCLLAFVHVSVEGGWCRPTLVNSDDEEDAGCDERRHHDDDNHNTNTTDGIRTTAAQQHDALHPPSLWLDGAFHPLLSRNSSSPVVPLHLHTTPSAGRVCIFTGPNGSGKSVAMQTVALVVYLSHIGCFVPCQRSARVAVVDRIVFVCDASSCAATTLDHRPSNGASAVTANRYAEACGGSSSFAGELLAVSRALTQGTRRSLILLDEFGRGTLAVDGVALLASFLLALVDPPIAAASGPTAVCPARSGCPTVMLATHYTEIFHKQIGLMDYPLVQHLQMTMTVVADGGAEGGSGTHMWLPPSTEVDNDDGANVLPHQSSEAGVVFSFTFWSRFGGPQGCRTAMQSNEERQLVAQQQHLQRHFGSCALQCARMCGVPAFLVQRMEALHMEDGHLFNVAGAFPEGAEGNDTTSSQEVLSAMSNGALLAALIRELDPTTVLLRSPGSTIGHKQLADRWAVVEEAMAQLCSSDG